MTVVKTGKFLPEDVFARIRSLAECHASSFEMVLLDRGGRCSRELFGEVKFAPLTDREVFKIRFHRLLNAEAEKLGLPPPETFVDEDGDDAINNYGVDFDTREVTAWEEP